MTETLFDLSYLVARELGAVVEGFATGGSTTTLVDTNDRLEADDYWNKGTMWLLRDSAGAGAAPESEFSVVADFVSSTSVVSLRTTLTTAIASGDKYALGKRRYPLQIITQKINEALRGMGPIAITDITTISGLAAGQSEYSLPIAAGMDLREVYVGWRADADDHDWSPVYDWSVQRSPIGTPDLLVIRKENLRLGLPVKLVYMDYHPDLNLGTDQLSQSVHSDHVVLSAIERCLNWRKTKVAGADPTIDDRLVQIAPKIEKMESKQQFDEPEVQPKLMIVKHRGGRRYPGEQSQYK